MKPEGVDEMERVMKLLDLGMRMDDIDELLKSISEGYSTIADEFTDINDALDYTINQRMEQITAEQPNAWIVDQKPGWYQDLKGNLYKYDGVVWDVVPENKPDELEFLGE